MKPDYINKKFKTILPLIKGGKEEDGYYYLKFGLSTDSTDLYDERVTEECLDDMIQQAKQINGFEAHQYGLGDIIGPVVDSWKEVHDDMRMMYVKVRVRPSITDKIKELVDTGVRLGGSIGGLYIKDSVQDGIRLLEKVKLLDATLTPIPVNWDTLGTAEATEKEACPNGLCKQIFRSIRTKYHNENPSDVGGGVKSHTKDYTKELEEPHMSEFEDFKTEMLQAQKEQHTELVDAIKALVPEQKEADPEEKKEALEFDEDALVEKTVTGVLKALGVKTPEAEPEPAPEDTIAKAITKAILEAGKNREGTRKSNPLGGEKFEPPTDPVEKKDSKGAMSTKDAAKALLSRRGIISA